MRSSPPFGTIAWAGTLLSRIPELIQECPRWQHRAEFPFFVKLARVADLWLAGFLPMIVHRTLTLVIVIVNHPVEG